jgi:predicted lysophospholipase L1 biosynthesis ABC-type transport system permease subunit
MTGRTGFPTIAAAVLVAALAFAVAGLGRAQTVPPSASSQTAQVQPKPEEIVSGPQNIKERTGVYVFLGWIWLSIVVLVCYLRLKAKEVDRLYELRFFSNADQQGEGSGQPDR